MQQEFLHNLQQYVERPEQGVNSRDARAWGLNGAVPLLPSKSRGNGGKSALPMLSTGHPSTIIL